jgi:hypothetical protein
MNRNELGPFHTGTKGLFVLPPFHGWNKSNNQRLQSTVKSEVGKQEIKFPDSAKLRKYERI